VTLLEQVRTTAPRHSGHARPIRTANRRASLPTDWARMERQLFIGRQEAKFVGDRVFHAFTWRRMLGALSEAMFRLAVWMVIAGGVIFWLTLTLGRFA